MEIKAFRTLFEENVAFSAKEARILLDDGTDGNKKARFMQKQEWCIIYERCYVCTNEVGRCNKDKITPRNFKA